MSNSQSPVDPVRVPSPTGSDRPSPETFLNLIAEPEPGWSAQFGGPDGIIGLTGTLLEDLAQQSSIIAAVRTAAIREQLRAEPGTAIARRHHISKQAVHKAAGAARTWKGDTW